MNTYVILLRGVNVGGKNSVPMADLRKILEEQGFSEVSTYIASGNVLLKSARPPGEVKERVETLIAGNFKLDDGFVKVLVLTPAQFRSVVENKPAGFGDEPETYHSDAIFLMDIDAAQALPAFDPREGVDRIWPGAGVIYSQRLSALRTKSRLNRIMSSPFYKSMTIRNWNTVTRLLEMLRKSEAGDGEGG